jgi:hypothetical protein
VDVLVDEIDGKRGVMVTERDIGGNGT